MKTINIKGVRFILYFILVALGVITIGVLMPDQGEPSKADAERAGKLTSIFLRARSIQFALEDISIKTGAYPEEDEAKQKIEVLRNNKDFFYCKKDELNYSLYYMGSDKKTGTDNDINFSLYANNLLKKTDEQIASMCAFR